MPTQAQIEALKNAAESARSMVGYYDTGAKRAQNAALEAAGMKPLHNDAGFAWDDAQRALYSKRAEALEGLLAELTAGQAEAA